LNRKAPDYFSPIPKQDPTAILQPGQRVRTVYPNVNTVQDAALFAEILEAETRASQVEREQISAMVTELLETSDELRKKGLDQMYKQTLLCFEVTRLRVDLERRLSNAAGDGTGSAAEPESEEDQP
jgi:hypothetical protein